MKERIRQIMVESIVVKEKMLADPGMIGLLEKIVELCVQPTHNTLPLNFRVDFIKTEAHFLPKPCT